MPLLANGVTDQGLGEVTSEARNGAGNPVLDDVAYLPTLSDNQSPHPTQAPGATTLRVGENRLEGGGGRDLRLGE